MSKRLLTEDECNRLENNFTYHPPKDEEQVLTYHEVRKKCKELGIFLSFRCPQSRELSLALTALEEVCMWANAAIARNEK